MKGSTLAHNTSGLPKLDLQPFDPTDLYAAARSNNSVLSQPRRPRPSRMFAGLFVVVGLALAAGAAVLLS